VRLLLAVETDLEPDAASGRRDRQERDWLDVAVIQPSTDSIHSLAEGTFRLSRLCFDLHDEWGIERHIALLSRPVRRELLWGLSVGAASLVGGHQWSTLVTFRRCPSIYFLRSS